MDASLLVLRWDSSLTIDWPFQFGSPQATATSSLLDSVNSYKKTTQTYPLDPSQLTELHCLLLVKSTILSYKSWSGRLGSHQRTTEATPLSPVSSPWVLRCGRIYYCSVELLCYSPLWWSYPKSNGIFRRERATFANR